MQYLTGTLTKALVDFFGNDVRRIEHAVEVLYHTRNIADTRPDIDSDILTAAALLHDLGIKPSERELGYNNGHTQEHYGPGEARTILEFIGFPAEKIDKVCDIVGNHHSPSRFDYRELEILKQADNLVNRQESLSSDENT